MEYSLMVHGDDARERQVDATSAEDAMRQLLGGAQDGPVHVTFLYAAATEAEAAGTDRFPATRQRTRSEDAGHTRTQVARRVP
ncbi:hypothetical protein [Actinomycetospora sp.]|uniref:hypothetical protein n=1 Tax=Actinomycetospora sp. TaxID=1872135 RepID=UPI002F3FEDC3